MTQPIPPPVYIASASEPALAPYWAALAEPIRQSGFLAAVPTTWNERQLEPPLPKILDAIRDSAGLVVLVGSRLGRVLSKEQGGDGDKSLEWLEVEAADKLGIPVLAFLVGDGEQEEIEDADGEQLKRFKKFLVENHTSDFVTSPEELATKVATVLGRLATTSASGRQGASGAPVSARHHVRWMSDGPAREDKLRRRPLAAVIADKLTELSQDPETTSFMTLLDGPWGAGKSTILGFIKDRLARASSSRWVIVDFDAWRQSHVGPAWWALLHGLRQQIKRGPWRHRMWITLAEQWRVLMPTFGLGSIFILLAAGWLLYTLFWGSGFQLGIADFANGAKAIATVLSVLGVLGGAGVALVRGMSWGSLRGARLFEDARANPMGDLASHFDWLLSKARGPVLFVVDDLDRCSHEFVVEFLDAVQTLMRNALPTEAENSVDPQGAGPKLFFIVAGDGRWIRCSYEVTHQEFVDAVNQPGRSLGHFFLDKLFQLVVTVPTPAEKLRKMYFNSLLGKEPDGPPEASLEQLRSRIDHGGSEQDVIAVLDEAAPGQREDLAVRAVEKLNQADVVQRTAAHVLEQYAPLIDPSPRSMKRFVMAYGVSRDIRLLEGWPVVPDLVARWTIARLRWPELADHLRNHPHALADPKRNKIPQPLRDLLDTPDVIAVIGPLDADGIQQATGQIPSTGTLATGRPIDEIVWVDVPGGTFQMGSSDFPFATPVHTVTVQGFKMSRFLVTNVQYGRFVQATDHRAPGHWVNGRVPPGKENHPVTQVSWDAACSYCAWLTGSGPDGGVIRLPTEAEWEYAARGPDGREYPWGNGLPTPNHANYYDSGVGGTTAVGRYPAGATLDTRIHDLAGNVVEWTEDAWHNNYQGAPVDGSAWTADIDPVRRVLRGGAFNVFPQPLRAAYRNDAPQDDAQHYDVGFRVVWSPSGGQSD